MPRTFAVDLDELDAKINEMTAFETTIESALTDLDQVVERLHLTWTGEAADAQRLAHQQWAAGMAQMKQGLGEIRAASQRAHENYTSAGRTNASMWAAVR